VDKRLSRAWHDVCVSPAANEGLLGQRPFVAVQYRLWNLEKARHGIVILRTSAAHSSA
jgi:hypothetical protein